MAIKSESLWDAHAKTPQHRANVASKPPPPQPKAAAKRPKGPEQQDEGREGKRVKMSSGGSANLSLPQGFFDDVGVTIDDDDEEEGDGDGVDGAPAMITTTTTSTSRPVVEEKKAVDNKAPLPTDFFDKSGGAAAAAGDSLDDEWAAFQADIAETEQEHAADGTSTTIDAATGTTAAAAVPSSHTISVAPMTAEESAAAVATAEEKRNVEQEEKEEDQDRMAEFFDEQSSLEERVRALKERRERLRSGMVGVESTAEAATTKTAEQVELPRRYSAMDVDEEGKGGATGMDINTGDDGGGDEDEDEEDESDQEDMYDLWSMGGRLK